MSISTDQTQVVKYDKHEVLCSKGSKMSLRVTHSRYFLDCFVVDVPVALNKVLAADTLIALVVSVTGPEVVVFHPPP